MLREIVEQLKACGFECEAGKLENNTAFQQLVELAAYEIEGMEVIRLSPDGRYIFLTTKMSFEDKERVAHIIGRLFTGETNFVIADLLPNGLKVIRLHESGHVEEVPAE
jgi:hypothetical protein